MDICDNCIYFFECEVATEGRQACYYFDGVSDEQ